MSRDLEVKMALCILEELAAVGGASRLKYLKSYRMISYWIGESYARQIVDKMVRGQYVRVEDDKVVLLRRFSVSKSVSRVLRELKSVIITMYKMRSRAEPSSRSHVDSR